MVLTPGPIRERMGQCVAVENGRSGPDYSGPSRLPKSNEANWEGPETELTRRAVDSFSAHSTEVYSCACRPKGPEVNSQGCKPLGPWIFNRRSPIGAAVRTVAPIGLYAQFQSLNQGFTPLAINCRRIAARPMLADE